MLFLDDYSSRFIEKFEDSVGDLVKKSGELLNTRKCLGNDMLGWLDLDANLDLITRVSNEILSKCDCVLVIGIGGSYLGAKMAIDFLSPLNKNNIHFVGFNLDSEYLSNVLEKCKDKSVHVVVISKSGNTIEIKSTLDVVFNFMKKKYNGSLKDRFTSITGKSGYLRKFSEDNKFRILDIPENVGGRFSVLTNVGLLPISLAGGNIREILRGALEIKKDYLSNFGICHRYALIRNALYKLGFKIELFCSFSMRLLSAMEWIKQLFGESEGKDFKGIFPSSSLFSTDLHSLGQFIQEGSKILFESIIFCDDKKNNLVVSQDFNDDSLRGISLDRLNERIFSSVVKAHNQGNVPCNIIKLEKFSEYELGKFIMFFEISCAISAITLGVNPFNQPGVEIYKANLKGLHTIAIR